MASPRPKLQFKDFADDLLYEILYHLPVQEIIRFRRVCRRLQETTHQRVVWSNAYRNSDLLRPEGPVSTHTAQDIEDLLVRAAKIQYKWSVLPDAQPVSCKFLDDLPTYAFDVAMISGRYLMVATQKKIAWYDLDLDEKQRLDIPVATYDADIPGMPVGMNLLSSQVNANNEGPDMAYVAFAANGSTKILKVRLPPSTSSIEIAAEFPLSNYFPVGFQLDNNFLLVIKEFQSREDPMEFFHIPTKRKYLVPLHARVHNLSDLNYMNYMITPTHLITMFPVTHQNKTELEIYQLPTSSLASTQLAISHKAVYPGAIWKITACASDVPPSNKLGSSDVRIGILATCYEAEGDDFRTIEILKRSSSVTHDIRPQTTSIFATSCPTACLALTQTHTNRGQTLMMHQVKPSAGTAWNTIVAKYLTLPGQQEGVILTAFDGFCGRICTVVQGAQRPRIAVWSMV